MIPSLFEIVKIGLYIVFVAVIVAMPFIAAKKMNVDLMGLIKKWMAQARERNRANRDDETDHKFLKHFEEKMKGGTNPRPEGIFECENGMCTRKINAGDHGAFIRSPDSGRRKIVCAECAQAFVKTGWIPIMTWGEQFKLSSAALILAGAAPQFVLNPRKVLAVPLSFKIGILYIALVLAANLLCLAYASGAFREKEG